MTNAPGHEPVPDDERARDAGSESRPMIRDVAEVLRVATMVQSLHDEVQRIELDPSATRRLTDVYRRAVDAISAELSSDLRDELSHLVGGLDPDTTSVADIKVMQAALTGWLQGLFQGLQAAYAGRLAAQQLPGGGGRPESAETYGQYL